jgi:hypothetical protein
MESPAKVRLNSCEDAFCSWANSGKLIRKGAVIKNSASATTNLTCNRRTRRSGGNESLAHSAQGRHFVKSCFAHSQTKSRASLSNEAIIANLSFVPTRLCTRQMGGVKRIWSGRKDLNLRPPGPEQAAETLSYWPVWLCSASNKSVWASIRQLMDSNRTQVARLHPSVN